VALWRSLAGAVLRPVACARRPAPRPAAVRPRAVRREPL